MDLHAKAQSFDRLNELLDEVVRGREARAEFDRLAVELRREGVQREEIVRLLMDRLGAKAEAARAQMRKVELDAGLEFPQRG